MIRTPSSAAIQTIHATQAGGGFYNDGGTLTLTNCLVSGNRASSGEAGIRSFRNGTLTMTDCTVSGNVTLLRGPAAPGAAVAAGQA